MGEWNEVPSAPIRVTMIYHTSRECQLPCPPTGCVCTGQPPRIRNVQFRNIVAMTTQPYPPKFGALTAGVFIGLPNSPIEGLVLDNVSVADPRGGGR